MPIVLRALSASGGSVNPSGQPEPSAISWPDRSAIPNFSSWQAGDLILVKCDGSAMGKFVQSVQGSLLSSSPPMGDPEWTHAAIYIGHGLAIESAPQRGVRYCPISHYALARDLRVRRLLRGGTPATRSEGESIAREATAHFEHAYSYWAVAQHLLWQASVPIPGQFFCSSFVAAVCFAAVQVDLASQIAHRPLLPGTLVNHPSFADLELDWKAPR